MDEIDKEKIRELNDSLSELTGTVNIAEKAVERVVERLGFGDKLKKKSEERVKAEEQATEAIEKQTNKKEEELKKQNEIFQKELSARKVQLDSNNQLVSTVVQLSKEQRDYIRLADKLNQKERERIQAMDAPGEAMSKMAGRINSADGIMNVFNEKILAMTATSTGLTASFIGVKAVFGGLMDATKVMTKSIYEGERGASVGAKAITAFASQIETASYTIGAALMFIPGLSVASRVIGAFISVMGWATKKAAEANEVAAKQNDDLFKSFNALSQAGLTTAAGMTDVFEELQTLGMTVAEIEKFNAIMKNNSKDLKLFGATTAEGGKKFAQVAGTLYKSEIGEKLELLGVTADEQREHTLRYMAQQTRMGLMLNKTQEQQVMGARAYIEELDRLATLTGTNRKEQEEAREAILKIEDLRAAQFEAQQRGDTKRAEELEKFAKAAAMVYRFDVRGAKGLAEYAAAGGPTGADSSAAMLTYAKGINAIKQGKGLEDVAVEMSKSAKDMLKLTAGTRRIGGDVSGLLTGKFGDIQDFVITIEKATELQRRQGGSLEDAIKTIQKEKEAGLDKDTKNNVEASRKQQAAAMTMDSVVKTFNYSAKLNKEASDTFASAVDKFASTVGAQKPAGGVPRTTMGDPFGQGTSIVAPSTRQAAENRINTQQAVEAAQATRERIEKEKGRGSDDAKAARIAEMRAREEAERARRAEETAAHNKARGLPAPKGAEPTTGTKEKHSAASLKSMGLNLKEGDVQAAGKELDPKLLEVAKKVKDTIPGFTNFTAFNDQFHNEKGRPASQHTEGKAFDFKLNYNPTVEQGKEIAKMLKDIGAGYVQDEYNFPSPGSNGKHIHVQLAKDGGAFNGPEDGYPVMLHGKETVLNKTQTEKISKKIEQVEKKPAETDVSALTTTSTTTTTSSNDNKEVVAMLAKLTDVMEGKMDSMLDVLNNGNDISGKILNYSMA